MHERAWNSAAAAASRSSSVAAPKVAVSSSPFLRMAARISSGVSCAATEHRETKAKDGRE